MDNSYEAFVREMTEDDAAGLTIGMRDKRGNLLILGGRGGNLWRLKNDLYAVSKEITASTELAVEAYNKANNTKLALDYIETIFNPWYEKQVEYILVPSRTTPGETYKVTKEPGGKIVCDPKCRGFRHYGHCWHTDAVKELTSEY